ncbi:MAG: hypothetical protein IBX44_02735 [Sulfurospirillum sp.]|nr:hypothetical protein [Sulfurospirillum sp.]
MAYMITVTRNRYNDQGTMEIDESISINADNINIVEDSRLATREKSRIIFNDDSSIYVIESKEQIANLINR